MTSRATRSLFLKVVSDTTDAARDLRELEGGATRFREGFKKASKAAALAAAAAGAAFVASSVEAGVQLEAFEDTARTVFAGIEGEALAAADAAQGIGLSRRAALEQLNYLGNLAQATGATTEESLALGEQTLALAADFAAFADVPTADVLEAISSATRGEYDALQRYLPTASAATLQRIALTEGIIEEGEALSGAASLQAVYALALRDGGAAIGAYNRESDSLSATTQRLAARWDNFQASVGQKILPLLERAARFFEEDLAPAIGVVVDFIRENWPPIYDQYIKPPLEKIQALASAVIGFLIDLWQDHGEQVLEFLQPAIDIIVSFGETVFEVLGGIIDFITAVFQGDWAAAWEAVQGIAEGIVDFFRELPGRLLDLIGNIVSAVVEIGVQIGKALVNSIIDIWNRIDPSISFSVPSWVPVIGGNKWSTGDIVPDLPRLATGGIVTSPTVAMIGEAGPEAVVPLPAAFGNEYNIYVEAGLSSPQDVADAVIEIVRDYDARNGLQFREAG